jgi:Flp pilus assembly protein TadD
MHRIHWSGLDARLRHSRFLRGERFPSLRRQHNFLASFLLLSLLLNAAAQENKSLAALISEGQRALQAGDFTTSTADFERARRISAENLEIDRGLLLSYLQDGRLDDAETLGESAVARWPHDSQLQHWMGIVYFKKGEDAKALETLRRAEDLSTNQSDIRFDAALVLLAENDYAGAARELEKAIALDPATPMAYLLLGRAYQNTNRTLQAIEQFQTALRLQPDIPLGHYHLGFAYASLGHNQEAITEYEKEVRRLPDDATVLYQLGHSQLAAGDYESAVANLRKAAEANPQDSQAFYDLGKALLLAGDSDAAIVALRRAVALNPGDPSAHYQLGHALEKTGQKKEAEQEFQTFATLKKAQPVTGGMATGRIQ